MAELAKAPRFARAFNFGNVGRRYKFKITRSKFLRRVESLQINIYLNEAPQLDEVPAPENLRHSAVENLLTGLNEDLESLTTEQQNIKQRILRKPGWWRAVGYGLAGAFIGAGLGYGSAKLQEYYRGQQNHDVAHSTNASAPEHPATAPMELASVDEHLEQN